MIGLALAVMVSTGAIDPNCTKEDICRDGYTATVRPTTSFTDSLKRWQLSGTQKSSKLEISGYEEDHFIPLELCGCPKCETNLWPQPWPEARKKDADETRLHRAVCKDQMTLEEAQEEIRQKWHIH